jgi:hypothetical protein
MDIDLSIDLIYCAGGNKKLVEIAYEAGFKLGVRSDKYHYPYPLTLVDVDYKSPDFEMHLRRVDKERPKYATVPDLSDKLVSEVDIARAIAQYERLKDYCQIVLIVPKLSGQIDLLPFEMAIGFSVPTRYGGAQYPLWELIGRRVHLLGGSPHGQMKYYQHVQAIAQVTSADGNMYQKMAIEKCKFWQAGGRNGGQWLEWPVKGKDQYFEAFDLSCRNIKKMWLNR